jgi:hypothetical protein
VVLAPVLRAVLVGLVVRGLARAVCRARGLMVAFPVLKGLLLLRPVGLGRAVRFSLATRRVLVV